MPYADPIIRKAFLASYYLKHKDKLKTRVAQWKRKHPDKLREQIQRYRERHPIKYREIRNSRRIKPEERQEASIIAAWEVKWKSKVSVYCFWCQKSFNPKYCHTDHVVSLSKGGKHILKNVAVSCRRCNLRKGCKHPTIWIRQLNQEMGREIDFLWC